MESERAYSEIAVTGFTNNADAGGMPVQGNAVTGPAMADEWDSIKQLFCTRKNNVENQAEGQNTGSGLKHQCPRSGHF